MSASPSCSRSTGAALLPIRQGDVSIFCGDSSIFTWLGEAGSYSHHVLLLHCSHPTSLPPAARLGLAGKLPHSYLMGLRRLSAMQALREVPTPTTLLAMGRETVLEDFLSLTEVF